VFTISHSFVQFQALLHHKEFLQDKYIQFSGLPDGVFFFLIWNVQMTIPRVTLLAVAISAAMLSPLAHAADPDTVVVTATVSGSAA
jgi:outer membrane receptor for ferrienterochelin and colicins